MIVELSSPFYNRKSTSVSVGQKKRRERLKAIAIDACLTFHSLSRVPSRVRARVRTLHVLDRGTHTVWDSRVLVLVLDRDIAPVLDPYSTNHDDLRVSSLSNGAMNEHCAVYCVSNEAVKNF